MTVQILNVSPTEYFDDPCETPSLSASIAHVLTSQSPAHAWQRHPRLGGTEKTPTRDMDTGSLVHAILLGTVADSLGLIDAENFRSKTAQEQRDAVRSQGKTPVLYSQYDEANAVATQLRIKLHEFGIDFSKGRSEFAIAWREETVSGPIWCRSRLDNLQPTLIRDLKTIRSAHPRICTKHLIEYGYDIQFAAYTRAAERLTPDAAGRIGFEFVFVETEPPFAVTPVRLDGQFRELGRLKWERACALWARCLKANTWPAYASDQPLTVSPPDWALQQEMNQ
jgi:hypothetical protein